MTACVNTKNYIAQPMYNSFKLSVGTSHVASCTSRSTDFREQRKLRLNLGKIGERLGRSLMKYQSFPYLYLEFRILSTSYSSSPSIISGPGQGSAAHSAISSGR